MKRLVAIAIVGLAAAALVAQEGIAAYVRNLPDGTSDIAGLPIIEVTENGQGAVVVLGSEDRPVSIRLLEPIQLDALESILDAVRESSLLPGAHSGTGWSLAIAELDISVGSSATALITPAIDEYRVRLNDEAVLLFSRRLMSAPTFRYDARIDRMAADLELEGILVLDDDEVAFPGWDRLSTSLLEWARSGLDTNDQRVMGTVLEIRVLSPVEAEEEKQTVVTSGPPEETWARFGIASLVESGEIVSFSADGISAGMPSILTQTTARWDLLRLGRSPDVAPIALSFGVGPFADVSLACLAECTDPTVTQRLGFGVAVTAGYSRVQPRIVDGVVEDPRLALGFDLHGRLNLATMINRADDTISPLYKSEYYATMSLMGVISPFLQTAYRPEFLVGPQFRVLPDLNEGGVALYSMGLGVGLRVRFDVREYSRPRAE